jgi:hypothetical protein
LLLFSSETWKHTGKPNRYRRQEVRREWKVRKFIEP